MKVVQHPVPEQPQHQQAIEATNSPLSPHFAGPPHVPSPPPAGSGVRRHVSLTYGSGVGGPRKMNSSGLKRSGTLQANPIQTHPQNPSPPDTTEGVEEDEYYEAEDTGAYDEEYARQQYQQNQGQQYVGSPIGRTSPWTPGNEWRSAGSSGFTSSSGGNSGNQSVAIDDVQRALSALEIASNSGGGQGGQNQMYHNPSNVGNYQAGQSAHPPRFNPTHPPSTQANLRGAGGNGNGGRKLQLTTDLEGRKTPQGAQYLHQQQYQQDNRSQASGGSWEQKDRSLSNRSSNPNLQYGYQQGGKGSGSNVPSVPPIPQQYIQQQQQPRMAGGAYNQGGGNQQQQQQQGAVGTSGQGQGFVNTPIDVPSLVLAKGYNPANFDTRPQFVR